MKTNRLGKFAGHLACANCGSAIVQNQVRRFIGNDNRYIPLCNNCVIRLRRKSEYFNLCAFCGRHAKYATWEARMTKSIGDLTYSTGNHIPEFWLLCEEHFEYMFRACHLREKQRKLDEFK